MTTHSGGSPEHSGTATHRPGPWDDNPRRLMRLAGIASRSILNRRKTDIHPYDPEDLTGELILFGCDPEAQKARGFYITPEVADELIVSRLIAVGGEWVTDLLKTNRADNGETEVFGHRFRASEAEELGIERGFGRPLPNEGRAFIEQALGDEDADPGHRRLMDRALERLCKGSGREDRADILWKRFVRQERLSGRERQLLGTVIEELTECLNAALLETPGWQFEGPGSRKVFSNASAAYRLETEGSSSKPEPQPLQSGQPFRDTGEQTVTRQGYKRKSPKRAGTFAEYVEQKNAGRIVAPPKSTPEHQYY